MIPLPPVPDHYFDAPCAERAATLLGTHLNERTRAQSQWRTPLVAVSIASNPDVKFSDNGNVRAIHDTLVTASFFHHPRYGHGHVLRTDGSLAAFWTGGSEVLVVHWTNLKEERVVLDGPTPQKRPPGLSAKAQAIRDAI